MKRYFAIAACMLFWVDAATWLIVSTLLKIYSITRTPIPVAVNPATTKDAYFVVPMVGYALIMWMLERKPSSTRP